MMRHRLLFALDRYESGQTALRFAAVVAKAGVWRHCPWIPSPSWGREAVGSGCAGARAQAFVTTGARRADAGEKQRPPTRA